MLRSVRVATPFLVLGAALAAPAIVGCGSSGSSVAQRSDDADGGIAGFGAGGFAGSAAGGTFGGGAVGGSAVGGDAGSAGSAGAPTDGPEICEGANVIDPASLDLPDCDDVCMGALCVPEGLVPEEQRDLLAACGDDGASRCVPEDLVRAGGDVLLPTCRSLNDAEGRCLSLCIPQVASQADRLPRDACRDGELCAPCFDPISGEATGACSIGCDLGPEEPAKTFAGCCDDLGACVPADLVPEDQRSALSADTCTGADELCAPRNLADPGSRPERCDSVGGFEGRCLPACLPDVASRADQLEQGSCADGELCAPCYDPTTGESTGACELNGDEPEDEAGTFGECCSGIGVCVPRSLVPAEQQDLLAEENCGTGALCAPTDLTDSSFQPPSCRSIGDFEGRCLPDCLPDIASQSDRLEQADCDDHHLCAPCYDPVSGVSTGACTLNGDEPAEEPGTFDDCCDGLGACVPADLVPTDQQSMLDADTCTGEDLLCAPQELADSSNQPASCRSIGGYEGRCLPACLPDVEAEADRLPQDTCADGHLCAPCYDPVSGAPTGACTLNGDEPAEPAGTFDACCGDLGMCVPTELVPAEQQSLLGTDTCSASGVLCAPTDLADPEHRPETCVVWPSDNGVEPNEDFEGRCLPACLPDVASQADRLEQGSCADGHLCTPCYDPITGEETGACRVNGDEPGSDRESNIFDRCCTVSGGAERGYCVPDPLIPEGEISSLPVDSCEGARHCVPDIKAVDPEAPFPSCDVGDKCVDADVFFGLLGSGQFVSGPESGACLPECMLQSVNPDGPVPEDGHNGQRDCQQGEVCVACQVQECMFNDCGGCILGTCNTGACGGVGDCPG